MPQTRGDPVHFNLCSLQSGALTEAPNDTTDVGITAGSFTWSEYDRGPEIPLSSEFRKGEIRCHDADNRVGAIVQLEILAHDTRIPAELGFPKIMAEHDHPVGAFLFFFRSERPTDQRQRTQQLKEVR